MADKEKEYKAFLKERGLTSSFRTYQSLKGKRKVVTTVNFSIYNGGGSTAKRVQLTKEKYGVVARDFETLHVIGRSRKKDFSTFLKGLSTQKTTIVNVRDRDFTIKRPRINLKNVYDQGSYNKELKRLRVQTDSNVPVRRDGSVVADVILWKNGIKSRVQAHSSGGYNLRDKSEVNKALDEAIGNCFAAVGFTPDNWDLVDWWYHSYRDYNGVTRG